MPFGPYKDMKDCIAKNQDKTSPGGYCATIHKKATGDFPSQKNSWREKMDTLIAEAITEDVAYSIANPAESDRVRDAAQLIFDKTYDSLNGEEKDLLNTWLKNQMNNNEPGAPLKEASPQLTVKPAKNEADGTPGFAIYFGSHRIEWAPGEGNWYETKEEAEKGLNRMKKSQEIKTDVDISKIKWETAGRDPTSREEIAWLNNQSQTQFRKQFSALTPEEKAIIVKDYDAALKQFREKKKKCKPCYGTGLADDDKSECPECGGAGWREDMSMATAGASVGVMMPGAGRKKEGPAADLYDQLRAIGWSNDRAYALADMTQDVESMKESKLGTCEICHKTTDVSSQYSDKKEKDVWVCQDCLEKHKDELGKQKGWGFPKDIMERLTEAITGKESWADGKAKWDACSQGQKITFLQKAGFSINLSDLNFDQLPEPVRKSMGLELDPYDGEHGMHDSLAESVKMRGRGRPKKPKTYKVSEKIKKLSEDLRTFGASSYKASELPKIKVPEGFDADECREAYKELVNKLGINANDMKDWETFHAAANKHGLLKSKKEKLMIKANRMESELDKISMKESPKTFRKMSVLNDKLAKIYREMMLLQESFILTQSNFHALELSRMLKAEYEVGTTVKDTKVYFPKSDEAKVIKALQAWQGVTPIVHQESIKASFNEQTYMVPLKKLPPSKESWNMIYNTLKETYPNKPGEMLRSATGYIWYKWLPKNNMQLSESAVKQAAKEMDFMNWQSKLEKLREAVMAPGDETQEDPLKPGPGNIRVPGVPIPLNEAAGKYTVVQDGQNIGTIDDLRKFMWLPMWDHQAEHTLIYQDHKVIFDSNKDSFTKLDGIPRN